ncbi:MAG: hypothetical protein AAF552_03645 [Pseudomonadota bacterium]
MDYQCYRCGNPLTGMILPVSRREECGNCDAEIHVCRMCIHYRSNRQQWCAEERAEPPSSRERANFCDYFAPAEGAYAGSNGDATQDALDQLSSLFKD